MLLVDYKYYTETFGGSSIPESSFQKKVIEASSKVNHYTFNRINSENISNDVRNATCEIAELLYNQELLKNTVISDKEVASETVGPHSKTYVNKASLIDKYLLTNQEIAKESYIICSRYLMHSGLMNRSIY